MTPLVSLSNGEPTILFTLLPALALQMILDLIEDRDRAASDETENSLPLDKITPGNLESIQDTWGSLKVGQVIKVNQNERFPADLILLKSSNPNGIAYVETRNLDGETNLKHKAAVRDM